MSATASSSLLDIDIGQVRDVLARADDALVHLLHRHALRTLPEAPDGRRARGGR